MDRMVKRGRPPSRKKVALGIAADSKAAAQTRWLALLEAERAGASKKELVSLCWRILSEVRTGTVKEVVLKKLRELEAPATDAEAAPDAANGESNPTGLALPSEGGLWREFLEWKRQQAPDGLAAPAEKRTAPADSGERESASTVGATPESDQSAAPDPPATDPADHSGESSAPNAGAGVKSLPAVPSRLREPVRKTDVRASDNDAVRRVNPRIFVPWQPVTRHVPVPPPEPPSSSGVWGMGAGPPIATEERSPRLSAQHNPWRGHSLSESGTPTSQPDIETPPDNLAGKLRLFLRGVRTGKDAGE